MQSTDIKEREQTPRARAAFTLIEVLIAAIILAIGLIGLAAVFPVVITQQRDATDLSMAISSGDSGEAMLAARLGNFSATIADLPPELEGRWQRISAFDSGKKDETPYLQMPFGNKFDLHLSRLERNVPIQGRLMGQRMIYTFTLEHNPLSERPGDTLEVWVTLRLQNDKLKRYWLRPDGTGKFMAQPGNESRLEEKPNAIDYLNSRLQFNVELYDAATVESVELTYTWLDDRLLAHEDRLSPSGRPRYSWEVCVRKGQNGQAQYCLFMYRFDGPKDADFNPDIPRSTGRLDEGMLRQGSFDVIFNSNRRRFFVRNPTGGDEAASIASGAFLLPADGSGPVKVLRSLTLDGERYWELDAPPTRVGNNGDLQILLGSHEYWYLPASVFLPKDQITWKISPLLSYTKQVDL